MSFETGSFKMKIKYCNVSEGVCQLALRAQAAAFPYFFFLLS